MRRNRLAVTAAAALAVLLPLGVSVALQGTATAKPAHTLKPGLARLMAQYGGKNRCPKGPLCSEIYTNPKGYGYVGHDEPAVNFYSKNAGAGNNVVTTLTLPKDSTKKGSTRQFMMHPAFWFGMAMCDDQSAPNPGGSPVGPTKACKSDSDSNIYTSTNSNNSHYIGLHPGTAFMEMQFYPPGWVDWPAGDSCDAHAYCAALNIDSLSENMNTGAINNADCFNFPFGGIEPVNFAFLTKDGVAQAPANPVDATINTYTPDPSKDLFMNPGDRVQVKMFDTSDGFKVVLHDLTAGTTGSMTASVANGFGHVNFDPNASQCSVSNEPFHPEYASSTRATRVPWAAHTYNVGYSDEIGHWETCFAGAVTSEGGSCLASPDDPESSDADDVGCFPASDSSFYKVSGCLGTDIDFDGRPYQRTWPGTLTNHSQDVARHGTPIMFTGLKYAHGGKYTNYGRVAFEADLQRIEDNTTPPCQRHVKNPADRHPGAGCRGLPAGAKFYPIFSTRKVHGQCVWQEGGAHLPGTIRDFGGKSTTEYGDGTTHAPKIAYPATGGTVTIRYNDYRHVLKGNPCPA
jgi:hypothetical protein